MDVGWRGGGNGLLEHQSRRHRSLRLESAPVSTVIVCVHGCGSAALSRFGCGGACRRSLGAEARAFSYPSVAADATSNARALAKFLTAIPRDTLTWSGIAWAAS